MFQIHMTCLIDDIQFLGPQHWGEQYDTCFGKHQSPININLLSVKEVKLPPLKLEGFDEQIEGLVVANNGHTGRYFH